MKESVQYSAEMFQPAQLTEAEKNKITRPSVGFWKDAWRRFRRNIGAMVGLIILLIMMLMAIIGPSLGKEDYQKQNLAQTNSEPTIASLFSNDYKLGTDHLGRDMWTRVWYGARISLAIAFLATFLELAIGATLGAVSGYYGGKVDEIIQRIIEILNSIPNLIIIILMLIVFEPGIVPIALALSISAWTGMARIVRAQTLKLKSQEYILAARTLGSGTKRIMFKHLIPNTIGPMIVSITFAIPSAIFFEAFLGFIGLGVRPPEASLGVILNDALGQMQMFPYQLFIPAVILSLIMLSFNLIGDGLRDALDPRMRK